MIGATWLPSGSPPMVGALGWPDEGSGWPSSLLKIHREVLVVLPQREEMKVGEEN